MASGFLFYAMALSLLAQGTNAAAKIRGAALAVDQMQHDNRLDINLSSSQRPAIDWESWGIGIGLGAVVGAVIAGAAVTFMGKSSEAEPKDAEQTQVDKEGDVVEDLVPVVEEEPEEVDSAATDYQQLLQILAQKVAQEVGPKLSKGAAVNNVLHSRMSQFSDNARSFFFNEMNGTAGAVLKEMDAPEAMMFLDFNSAVEANFPPAAILVAGVMSPSVISMMSVHHMIQMLIVGLPVMILCMFAIYIDWSQPCSIPTIFTWLFTQCALAACLVVGHGALVLKAALGKRQLAAKAAELAENKSGDDASDMRDEFVGNTIILQEALVIESNIRHSFFNHVVGLATTLWVVTTIWNLVLICGWTFVPGVTAFHPKAAEVAKGDYCGAWMTVLTLRINMLLAILFLFLNVATVVKWVCDCMIENQGFQEGVLKQAQALDKNGTGLPVVELLVKAFLLRGSSDTLNSKLSVVQAQKAKMEKDKSALESQLKSLGYEIDAAKAEEGTLKSTAEEKGGDLQSAVAKLTNSSVESWKSQGDSALAEAEAKAQQVREETTKALEDLWAKIQQLVAKAQECADQAIAAAKDPELQKKLKAMADEAMEKAQEVAAAANDPEKRAQLMAAAQKAMDDAKAAAEEVAAAVNDPEKRAELVAAAQKAMDDAKAAAADAADALQDPEMQKKMKEAAQNAMDQAQQGAQSAIAAAQDPKLLEKLNEAAEQAKKDAEALVKQAKEAASDPELQKKLQEKAQQALKDAQAAAETAKAAVQDPETQKKLAAAAQQLTPGQK